MSDLPYYTEAPMDLTKQFTKALDEAAVELGRKNTREDRVDWDKVNQRMEAWWKEQGYRFP